MDGASSRPSGARPSREAQERAGERAIRILAIETSCDETGVAIVEDGRRIRSNIVASQLVHQDTGGIVPEVAAREHLRAIDALTEKALGDAGCQLTEIDAIAATVGPGLIGCLLVGANYARGLALSAGLPFVGVNHLEGHVYANWLEEREATPDKRGVAVTRVEPGSFAEDIGLMERDVIIAINRQPVSSVEDIRRIQQTLKGGDPVAFRVVRTASVALRGRGGVPATQTMFLSGTLPQK